jgi:hypothetical protein
MGNVVHNATKQPPTNISLDQPMFDDKLFHNLSNNSLSTIENVAISLAHALNT